MKLELREGYSHATTVRALFLEYTEYLISQDANFRHYLELQNYDGEHAGCIALRRNDGKSCELKRLYVRPAFRGQGVASALVERLLDDAREIGYAYVQLDTLPFLAEAIGLYRKYGFYETPPYNENPMGTSIYMRLDL